MQAQDFYPRLQVSEIDDLPLVLAGPILRHTGPDTATVWVALKQAAEIRISVFPAKHPDRIRGRGSAHTVALGSHLHIAVISATPEKELFGPDAVYGYDLAFETETGNLDFARAMGKFGIPSYGDYQHPTFSLPPEDLNRVKVLFGSCRKPHGEGRDAMEAVDLMIRDSVEKDSLRPQLLFLMGDQIYSDDVADCLLPYLELNSEKLIGQREPLPEAGDPGFQKAGLRCKPAWDYGGFTSFTNHSHLFRFGESMAMYLMAWSEVLWPENLPHFEDLYDDEDFRGFWKKHHLTDTKKKDMKHRFDTQRQRLQVFRETIPKVRKAMANIATYMIFDDHEVTDDWFLNREWCLRVLNRPLGRRAVRNAMLSYAFCQGWGNTPAQFSKPQTGHKPGYQLLKTASDWVLSGFEEKYNDLIDRLLSIPTATPELRQLNHNLHESCTWHFRVYGPRFEVLVLDTRTWRGFPGDEHSDIPDLISGPGWHQLEPGPRPQTEITIIVAPTNVIDIPHTSQLSKLAAKIKSPFHSDYGDSWETQTEAFEQLLGRLAGVAYPERKRRQLVILSGDIHYGFAARFRYWGNYTYGSDTKAENLEYVCAHLTSSAFKNPNIFTYLFHRWGYLPRFPKPMLWAGWHKLPEIKITSFRGRVKAFFLGLRTRSIKAQPPLMNLGSLPREVSVAEEPHWRYRIDFLKKDKDHPNPESYSYLEDEQALERVKRKNLGSSIIGVNNMGSLRFTWPEDEEARFVEQRLWWRADENQPLAPLTHFSISLAYDHPEYPMPKLPQEKDGS